MGKVAKEALGRDERVLAEFMRLMNRPLSAQNVADRLNGAIKKTGCMKGLEGLVAKGLLCAKEYGKTKLFYHCQEGLGEGGHAEALENGIKDLEEETAQLKECVSNLERRKQEVHERLSSCEIEREIERGIKAVEELQENCTEARRTEVVEPEEIHSIEGRLKMNRGEERKRRRLCGNMLSEISEMLDERLPVVKEMLGFEDLVTS